MIYKATLNLATPVSLSERPVFDALLYYCYMAERVSKYDYLSPTGAELRDVLSTVRLPLNSCDGFYLCSYAFHGESVLGMDSWKKRWHSRHDEYADFGKAMRRVNTASGEYKSYNVPFPAMSVERIWFYYDTNQPDEVRRLLDNYLVGIGKKVAIGFGWVRSIDYELARSEAGFRVYCRPLPKSFMLSNIEAIFPEFPKLTRKPGAFRPPYWYPEYQEQIIIPEICNDNGM
jgi:hypothetical protein